jgi:hypothetical protein
MNKFNTLFYLGLIPIILILAVASAIIWAAFNYEDKPPFYKDQKKTEAKEVIKEVEKIVYDTVEVKIPCKRQHVEIKPTKDTI